MHHHVAHAVGHTYLFHTWVEGLRLWKCILAEVREPIALVIMPDHVHLLHAHEIHRQLAHAIGSYIHHRNTERGETGSGVRRLPVGARVVGSEKQRRAERYLYLNPVRAHLAGDPLEWPLSTYRDHLGLSPWPVVTVARNPERTHAWVSADPSVHVNGSKFPVPSLNADDLVQVLHATSAVTRTPLAWMQRSGPPRTLFLRAAAELCPRVPRGQVAALVGAERPTAIRASKVRDPAVRVVAQAVGDPRFQPLHGLDLRRLPGWTG